MRQRFLLFIMMFTFLYTAKTWQMAHSIQRFSKYGEFFDSYVKMDVCCQNRRREELESVLEDVWTRFGDINSRFSVYDPHSDINKINQAYNASISVPEDTYERIKNSLDYYKISNGVYDITVEPLITLWKTRGQEGVMPTDEEIRQAMAKVDIKTISLLDNHRIRLTRPDVKINIDSIGDGFAADEAAKILRSHGFSDFLVDASGEIYAGGHNCQGRKWRIGVQDPQDKEKIIDVIELSDMAVSTSGSYERFYEIDGKSWSHIIDPRSGYPARGIVSATVVAPSAELADFLSTAFCILPASESLQIIDSFGKDHAAMLITENEGKEQEVISNGYNEFR
ncbi:MAG: hypothetical protein A2306_07225 [Omnitrophica WOR_2 bacterium RIFOXYB2_FULL_38_16]|nr:MAG: hypothetical protein A2243_06375 [Omnitrophica WOR_2 bacterium RIFOXYA2_FULL_38_17]OGX57877.1 MAG: hypothetical protein A2447_08885 [Omnitrophica WOR_2 bacterium RIFOXYC2_FULL_38_12]OGX59004.1 MAG: hypothetical protein A2306_07225 [Omnitrophica WOR_2 bacterium RIFOXYB2_FULL_38_16]